MKAKEWLKANGHIAEITRGRISGENHSRIAQAIANGLVLSDYNKGNESKATKTTRAAKPKVKSVSSNDVVADIRYTYPEDEFTAYRFDGTKKIPVGMRTVCNTCRNSLVGCFCGEPKIWVDHNTEAMVYFSPTTKG